MFAQVLVLKDSTIKVLRKLEVSLLPAVTE